MTALSPGHSRIDTHFTSRTTRRFAVEPGQLPGITFPLTTETRKRKFPWITNMSSAQGAQRRGVKALLPEYHVSSQFGAAPASAAFRLAGGAINKIIQRPGYIALSSATAGGQPDQTQNPGQPPDPYNRDGTLQTWKDGDPSSVILHGHCTFEEPPTPSQWHPGQQAVEVPCRKCYTVNDISFDPNRKDIMASAGNDGFVQLWLDGRKLDDAYYEYPQAPHDVVYRPSDSLLAVTCRDGIVYVHSTRSRSQLGDPVVLRVAPPHARHSVGAIAWGRAASADMLFASSEPQSEEDCNGFHVAFNPDRGTRRVIEFSAEESGDAMAVDPEGGRLALCTTGEGATHAMRIYDVRRKDGRRAIQEVQLDTFHPPPLSDPSVPFHDEVKSMAFSPDGVLLVVARSDDEVHVYDSRFMQRGREPISRFLHWDEDSCTPGGYRWGVVDAVWVDGWCGRGLGIVSGGTDGCIRFWDVRRSDDVSLNGEVLARSNYDIGHFSVGDPRIGERSLIVGDNGGRVYVYDYTATGHLRHFSP
ncbi:WD40-repeat-containing domain protein [Gloeopeniophorella convolvens]|nr:WD40-repeat-containing domain protein [Gloeopeniophorella convolvens]